MHSCVQYDASIFRDVEIFTALLATGNTGIVSSCCLQICMYTNDVFHFVYRIYNEAMKNYTTENASVMPLISK